MYRLDELKWDYNPVTSTRWNFIPQVGRLYRVARRPPFGGAWGIDGKAVFVIGVFEEQEEDQSGITTRLFMVCLVEETRRHIPLESAQNFYSGHDIFFTFTEITEDTVPIGT